MSWFTNIFSSGVDKVVDSVGTALDNLITSDEEKLILKNALQNAMNTYNLELEKEANKFEGEITARWKSDNDNIITRMVRPMGFIYTYLLFGVVMFADGNIGNFVVKASYIPLLETLLVTYTVAYVGSRGLEKYGKIKNKGL